MKGDTVVVSDTRKVVTKKLDYDYFRKPSAYKLKIINELKQDTISL